MQALDLEMLAARVTGVLGASMPGVRVTTLRPFLTGASSLTYDATLEDGTMDRAVVKVAPPGLAPVRNRDVLRQARLLDILATVVGIEVPEVLACDDGAPPEVPPLFVMTLVAGDDLEPLHDVDAPVAPAADVESRSLMALRMLAALQAVDPGAVGLGDEPVGTIVDELDRWEKAFGTIDDELRAGADETVAMLRRHVPEQDRPVIVHGDWRLGNMLSVGPSIRAVIDWEIWSIGDPRFDLAWMLMMNDRRHPRARTAGEGVPSVERLLQEYEQAKGSPVADFAWFAALARYKQAAITALIVKNNRKLAEPNPDSLTLAPVVPVLLDWARRILADDRTHA
jgi:aminoglycoside phosphotransferase (APT) family kinase protein